MNADHTILALKRFVRQRGFPRVILSDNARQFILSKSVIERTWKLLTYDTNLHDYVTSAGIRWEHMTERAPSRRAVYERLIGNVKYFF